MTSVHDPGTVRDQTCTEMSDLRTLPAALIETEQVEATVMGKKVRNWITQRGSKCPLSCLRRFPLKLEINADVREQR